MSMNREQELQHRNDELLMKLTNVVDGYNQLQATIEQQAAKIAELREALGDAIFFVEHETIPSREIVQMANKALASTNSTWLAEHDKEVRRKVLNEAYKEVDCGITHVRWALEIISRMAEQGEPK